MTILDFEGLPEIVTVLLGALSPILVGWIKKSVQSATWRFFIAQALAALVGVISALVIGIPTEELVSFAAYAFAGSQAAYHYWKGLIGDSKR